MQAKGTQFDIKVGCIIGSQVYTHTTKQGN